MMKTMKMVMMMMMMMVMMKMMMMMMMMMMMIQWTNEYCDPSTVGERRGRNSLSAFFRNS